MVVKAHLRCGQRHRGERAHQRGIGVGQILEVRVGNGERIGRQHPGEVLGAVDPDRVGGQWLDPTAHVAVVEVVLTRGIGHRGSDQCRALIQVNRDARQGILGRGLDAVVVGVNPDPITDFDGGFVTQRFDIAEGIGLAERRARLREGRRILRNLQLDALNNVARGVVIGHDAARGHTKRRECGREDLCQAWNLLQAATLTVGVEHVVVVELAVD